MRTDEILSHFNDARPTRAGWSARCPAHDDKTASLSIGTGADGRVLLHCHAGCAPDKICASVNLTTADLFESPLQSRQSDKPKQSFTTADAAIECLERQHGPHAAKWEYHDASGELVGVVVRWNLNDGKKIRPVAKLTDGWHIAAMPSPRPLYRLDELKSAIRIYVCEGEKATDAAQSIGVAATTSSGGAQAADKTDWTPLAGKDVILLPDNDTPGRRYADQVAKIMRGLNPPAVVKTVELPGLPQGGDIADFLDQRDATEPEALRAEIEGLGESAKAVEGNESTELRHAPKSAIQLCELYPTLRKPVIHGLLRQGESMNIVAPSKAGKSWLTLNTAISIAAGRNMLDTFPVEPGYVLILDNELHPETIAYRIRRVVEAMGLTLADIGDRLFVECWRGKGADISSMASYVAEIERGRYNLVIIDSLYRAWPPGCEENANADVTAVYNSLDAYADRLQAAFMTVHHASKGNQSGKSVTDTGSGAGAISRAPDTHLVLRPHEQDGAVVVEAALRSWPKLEPRCMRWEFPLWQRADELDPTQLKSDRPRRRAAKPEAKEAQPEWTPTMLCDAFVTPSPQLRDAILDRAVEYGHMSRRKAEQLLRVALSDGIAHRHQARSNAAVQIASVPVVAA